MAAQNTTTDTPTSTTAERDSGSNFIRSIIEEDVAAGKHGGNVITRFPPEPNGFLHIGHAKSIVLNFGLAADFEGRCHLRFDDTNPETEDIRYAKAIQRDVKWLGYDWGDHLYFASDYFEQFYQYAEKLIKDGKAYVDSLSEEEIREYRGTVTEPGRPSPYRDRSVEENLDLFRRMRAGEFEDGEHVLRAKIDMASPHMILRDPLLYRIRHATHYRRGDEWCIYPMYDFAHPLEDAIEGVTHSLCTLEFDNNRKVYDWVLENTVGSPRPHQYEFARLNMDYTIMSKRKLLRLVKEGHVGGWDDPRLPTIAGLRRRGVTPESIRAFAELIGVARAESRVDISHFEYAIRDDLNYRAPRVMGVIDPLKVVITNFPEDKTEWLEANYWPRDIEKDEFRKVPFTRELYIERDDFMEDPPKDFYRLAPGREVRLRYAYFLTCEEVVKDDDGNVVELHCTYDPETLGGAPDGRRPKGTIHWVSAEHALPAEIRLVDRLFSVPDPEGGEEDYITHLNPHSMDVAEGFVEPSIADDAPDTRYQFERQGYFWQDPEHSSPERLVFNRIVSMRDTWASKQKEDEKQEQESRKKKEEPYNPQIHRDPAKDFDEEQLQRLERYTSEVGLDRDSAVLLIDQPALMLFFEDARETASDPQTLANWILNELLGLLEGQSVADVPFTPEQFGRLVTRIEDGTVSGRIGKDILSNMMKSGQDPDTIIEQKNLRQIDDREALRPIVDRILTRHPDKAEEYRMGKRGLMGFFVGQVMRETQGKANPQLVQELFRERLIEQRLD